MRNSNLRSIHIHVKTSQGAFNMLLLFGIFIALSACVPVISTVYLAPSWTGRVIDASTLKPIKDVEVYHVFAWDKFKAAGKSPANDMAKVEYWPDISAVKTDGQGLFTLDGLTDNVLEFRLPVTGAMYSSAALALQAQSYTETFILDRNMRYGEAEMNKNDLGYIALDPHPQTIAPVPFKGDYVHIEEVETIAANCNHGLWTLATRKLNAARKVLQSHKWHDLRAGCALNMKQREMLISVYASVPDYWARAKRSCNSTGLRDRNTADGFVKKLKVEVDDVLAIQHCKP